MSTALDLCFQNIIGLSRTDCDCFTDDMPIDSNNSESGLYLDELEGLNLKMVESAADCEGGLWDLMQKARSNAIIQFRSDMIAQLHQKYVLKRKPYIGAIGKTGYQKSLNITSTYAGASYYCAPMRGGIMRLKRIGTCFQNTGSFTITVYNSLQDDAIGTFTVNTTANRMEWNNITTTDYPMVDESGESIQYYFAYSVADSGQPKDNLAICGGCGERHYWSVEAPKFAAAKNKWSEFVMVSGFTGSNVSTNERRDGLSCGSQYCNGIILEVEFLCDIQGLLCAQLTDFAQNQIAVVIAATIRYMAGMQLVDAILATNNPGYYTMSDRERLVEKKNQYAAEYVRRVEQILPQAINIDYNDCFTCDNSHAPRKAGIYS